MDRKDALLAIMGMAGQHAFSPVQLQKAAFLVDRNIPNLFDSNSRFDFKPYDYGPFDSTVYAEVRALEDTGLAKTTRSPSGFNQYRLTDAGLAASSSVAQHLDKDMRAYMEKLVQWVISLSFARLVKSIYEAYPDMKANSIFID